MEIVSEENISTKRAIHNLKKFIQEPFLEEADPDLYKSVNLIYKNLMISKDEIICPSIPNNTEGEEAKEPEVNEKEAEDAIETEELKPKKKKHHKKQE